MPDLRAERQLILLSAGTAARREAMRDRARRLDEQVDWAQLARTLYERRLLSLLGPRLLTLTGESADGEFAEAVERATEANRRQASFLQLVCLRLVAMLADASVPCAPLKGPVLGEAIHGDLGRRPSRDIDLLVAPEHLPAAVDVARELGYAAPTDHLQRGGLPRLHFTLVHERGELPAIELHWRIHWYERRFARERLLPASPRPPAEWRPKPVDELASLLLFYARDGFVDLRLATDLSAWWDLHGGHVPADAVNQLALEYPALARPICVALAVSERVVGIPAAELADIRKLGLRDRMAVRLADPNPDASAAQLYANMGLIDGLLTPARQLGEFLRRQVLLPPEVLSEYIRSNPSFRAKSSLDYGMRVLARYGFALARMVRTPEALR